MYNYSQISLDRINNQIAELEKMKTQIQQPIQQPTNLTQNFQLTPQNRDVIKYANSMEEVERDMVLGDTPYFSRDMSVVWIKNLKGDIKTYELTEIIPKDDRDLKIEYLQAEIEELKKGMIKNEPASNVDDATSNSSKDEEPTGISKITKLGKKH